MKYIAPSSFDCFVRDYTPQVRKSIASRKRKYQTRLAEDDLVQEFFVKSLREDTLEKYDPEKASFKTYLDRVINNFFISELRKQLSHEQRELIKDSAPLDEDKKVVEPACEAESELFGSDDDYLLVLRIIDAIPRVEERVLIKLKLYHPGIHLCDDERELLKRSCNCSNSGIEQKLLDLYEKKPGSGNGLRNEDIASFVPFSAGSITTTFQRLVKKHIIEQYMIMKGTQD